MTRLSGIGRPAPPAAGSGKRAASGGGFSVGTGAGAAPAASAAPVAPVLVGSMLALQETPGEPVRDRAARRHGETMLQLLAALQRAQLGGADGGDRALADLAAALRAVPDAADPALRRLVGAVALRAQIELARASS